MYWKSNNLIVYIICFLKPISIPIIIISNYAPICVNVSIVTQLKYKPSILDNPPPFKQRLKLPRTTRGSWRWIRAWAPTPGELNYCLPYLLTFIILKCVCAFVETFRVLVDGMCEPSLNCTVPVSSSSLSCFFTIVTTNIHFTLSWPLFYLAFLNQLMLISVSKVKCKNSQPFGVVLISILFFNPWFWFSNIMIRPHSVIATDYQVDWILMSHLFQCQSKIKSRERLPRVPHNLHPIHSIITLLQNWNRRVNLIRRR